MAGLDTRGLASGFAQGFGLADQYFRGQEQSARQDEQMAMQRERMDMQREQFDMQQEQAQRAQDIETLQFTLGKIASGMDVSEEEVEVLRRNPKFWPALDPDTDLSLQQAEAVIDPQSPVDINDPESLAALNQMFGAEINKGDGGEKRVVGMYPAPDGGSVALELEVVGEDGSRYTAPMTQGRSNREDDDLVMQVPVERLVEQTQGIRALRQAFNTPEAQQHASQVLRLLRGDSERWETEQHPVLGMIQRNSATGEVKPVRGGAGSADARRTGSGRPPSRIQEAEYLLERGVYDTFDEAYAAVRERAGEGLTRDRLELDVIGDDIDRVSRRLENLLPSDEGYDDLTRELEHLQAERARVTQRVFGNDYRASGQEEVPREPPGGQAAPQQAIDYLRDNDSEQLRQAFLDKYGYLPEGF